MFYSPRQKQNETWRYFSYSLVHANGNHLGVNLVLLVGLGTSLHMTNGTLVLLLLYILGVSIFCTIVTLLITDLIDLNTEHRFLKVVSGSMTYFVFDATSQPLVGCSGGVYCLVGIFHWHLNHDKKFHCQLKHDHIFHCQQSIITKSKEIKTTFQ